MARSGIMTVELDYGKLGMRIKEARIAKGLTQENLAESVNCNTSHISNIENNHTKVSLNVLLAIANALDTSIDYLLTEQYKDTSCGVDNEIIRILANFDAEWKQKILNMIKALC
jgi:transcriptional regulator with XRE-family HTH domain